MGLVKKPGQLDPIELESNKCLSNPSASVAMARTNVFNSATSEFYVNLVDTHSWTTRTRQTLATRCLARWCKGTDVVDAIAAMPTGVFNGSPDVPLTDTTTTMAASEQVSQTAKKACDR